jgi:hypothetical protein
VLRRPGGGADVAEEAGTDGRVRRGWQCGHREYPFSSRLSARLAARRGRAGKRRRPRGSENLAGERPG